MHIHSMRIAAIGPFAGAHTINFAELGAGGIFLLEGPTGAGKSTIIDAIVFALYGKVAAADASEERLRSNHVGPEVESSVDLIFETGHGIYRVLRSPAYDRPKQRGSGTVRQNVKVQLWRLSSPDAVATGEQMSTRADEVGLEVARLIGLSREQFVQTIVLPQGEFASFLKAKPEDRRGLLERVFGTEIYQRIQAELVAARVGANRSLAGAQASIATAVAAFAGAANLDPEPRETLEALVVDADSEDLLLAHQDLLTRIGHDAADAAHASATATATSDAAQSQAQASKALAAATAQREDLRRRRTALASGAAAHAGRLAQVASARTAAQVEIYLGALDRSALDLVEAERTLTAAFTRTPWVEITTVAGAQGLGDWRLGASGDVPGLDVLATSLAGEPIDVAGQIEGRRDRIGDLRRAAQLEDQLPGQSATLASGEKDLIVRREAREAAERSRVDRPADRKALDVARLAAHEVGHGAPGHESEVKQATDALTHARAYAVIERELTDLEPTITAAHARASEALAHVGALRQARIDGMAGELAAGLIPGQPCVVCGGIEHPAPATLDEDHVSAATVAAAETTSRAAEHDLATLTDRRTERRQAGAVHVAGTGGLDEDQAQAKVAQASAARDGARAAIARAAELAAELEKFDEDTEALSAKAAADDEWLMAQAVTLAGLSETVAAHRRDVEEAIAAAQSWRAGADPVDTKPLAAAALIKEFTAEVAALENLLAQVEGRRRALAEVDRARTDACAALDAQGFADANAARTALLDASVVGELERKIKDHDAERALVTAGLAAEAITGLDDALTVEGTLESAAQAAAAATAAATAAHELSGIAAHRTGVHTSAQRAATRVRDAVADSAHLRQRLAPVLRIANLADASSGDNSSKLTLGTYVLTRRFEQVLDAANDRLREMSSGRYELQRSDEKESRKGRLLGLALRVLDHNTGSHRDPSTLSGGETFYVSLCLALGLADIVTAEAGGVDLGTLFVDEGFGSLDPETLELVMGELGRLCAGGRMVGVVSHVEAMKSTISDRISIRRVADGSSTLTVLAGAG